MKNTRVLLSINIKRLREAAGWDQDDLAEAAGLSKGMIAHLEQGRKAPSPETLDKVVKGLKTHHAELFLDDSLEKTKIKTVGELTPAELEVIVSRASKRDGIINLENARLKKKVDSIPEDFFDHWADLKAGRQAVCLYVLTRDKRFVSFLSDETLKQIEAVLRSADRETVRPPR